MSNSYVSAAFALATTRAEAELVRECVDLVNALDDDVARKHHQRLRDGASKAFQRAFPPGEGGPLGTYLALFDDADFPLFDCELDVTADHETARLFFSGDQMAVSAVAGLIQRTCKSALPCGFAYAWYSDRLRADEFGGGCFVIAADGIENFNTHALLGRALDQACESAA